MTPSEGLMLIPYLFAASMTGVFLSAVVIHAFWSRTNASS